MRELTEKEMNLVAGGIFQRPGDDRTSIGDPFPLGPPLPEEVEMKAVEMEVVHQTTIPLLRG